MPVRSLGYRTDLIFPRFEGEVLQRNGYIVIRTPSNPEYHWGNFLLFDRAPRDGDLPEWKRLFDEEIAGAIPTKHFAFGWDDPEANQDQAAQFVAAGFELQYNVVLAAEEVRRPKKHNDDIEVRPLGSDDDWSQATATQIACREPQYPQEGYTQFKERQMQRYRAMSDAELGHWFGAFLDGRLVADLGIFRDGEVGRFQSVETHPDFRRRGICSTLVHIASQHAFEQMNIETLVMVADPADHAIGIYRSVGFRDQEKQIGVSWWPRAAE